MGKKWLLIAAGILIITLILVVLNIKKANIPLRVKDGKVTSISGLANKAMDLEVKGDMPEAKATYQKLVSEFPNSNEVANWEKKIEELNLKLLFSSLVVPNKSTLYEIRPGDTLNKIANQFKTTVELIMRSNNLRDSKIVPGRKVKIWTSPFSVVVDKSQNTLILKSDEEVIKTYIVSTGLNNSTPVGNFKITNKLPNPTWFKAGAVVPASSPENVLGSRWLGFDLPGYGIHGTIDPKNLGKQVTQGCVRMANTEVEELYSIVPVGTEVTIVD